MDRRRYLALLGMTALAGCASNGEETTTTRDQGSPVLEPTQTQTAMATPTEDTPRQTPTETPTPEPASFNIMLTNGGTHQVGESWVQDIKVVNRGEQEGTLDSTLQYRTGSGGWQFITDVSLTVPGKSNRKFKTRLGPFNSAGIVEFRIVDAGRFEATIEAKPADFKVTNLPAGEFPVDGLWPLGFTVSNVGDKRGQFEATVQRQSFGEEWQDVTDVQLTVPAGGSETYSETRQTPDETGLYYYRLTGTDATWSFSVIDLAEAISVLPNQRNQLN